MSEYNDEVKKEKDCGCSNHSDGGCGCSNHSDGGCGCSNRSDGGCGCESQTNASKENDDFLTQDFPLPKPTLVTLATTLAQQAMVSMGVLPNPATGKSVFMLNQATHLIDAVELIFEKTAGNRSEEETKIIENVLHELRMLFVAASNEKNRRDAEKTGMK